MGSTEEVGSSCGYRKLAEMARIGRDKRRQIVPDTSSGDRKTEYRGGQAVMTSTLIAGGI